MLKQRMIGILILKNGMVVQSINFHRYLPVGKPEIAIEFLNSWGIDEIVLLDIDATKEGRPPDFEVVSRVSRKCFVPLTVGGGINNLSDIQRLIRYGADKVSINSAAVRTPQLIKDAAQMFGDQCVVVSIDAKKNVVGKYEVFLDSGKVATGLHPIDLARQAEAQGAGEILLNSIDRDGDKSGFDIDLITSISQAVMIPVIACGGAGHPSHFLECLKEGQVSAVAAGNYFHFTEHSPIVTKAFLRQRGWPTIRGDTYAAYDEFMFDEQGRVARRSDTYLQKLRFEYQPKEVI